MVAPGAAFGLTALPGPLSVCRVITYAAADRVIGQSRNRGRGVIEETKRRSKAQEDAEMLLCYDRLEALASNGSQLTHMFNFNHLS